MNIVQREIALATNKHLKEMRMMQPRQFDVEQFYLYCGEFAANLADTLKQSNPAMNSREFMHICLEGV